ncbi:Resolvase, N terminal domain-containing protein [Obelidium mucronatum]|nr:Resolvase, N terminal domain-containing protein [Obelidium mucronatum]KAI9344569.1 Resolvase, N terminal domain-containing protein [Obelidium mucronatum]
MADLGSPSIVDQLLAMYRCSAPTLGRGASLVLYVRKSVESKSQSCQQQRDFVSEWAASKGFRIAAVFEEVESGAKADRPQLEAALNQVLADSSMSGLVTYKVDRLSRDGGFTKAVLARLSSGAKFYMSAAEPDLFFAPGQFEMNAQMTLLFKSTLAEAERIGIAATTAQHMRMKKNAGSPVSNKSAYGTRFCAHYSDGSILLSYVLNTLPKDRLVSVTVVPCPQEELLATTAIKFSWTQLLQKTQSKRTAVFNHVSLLGLDMDPRSNAGSSRPKKRQIYNFHRNIQSYMKQLKERRALDKLLQSFNQSSASVVSPVSSSGSGCNVVV